MLDDNAVCPLCGEPAKTGGDVMQWGVYANVNMRYWWIHLQCAIWAGEAAERVRRAPPFEMSPNESDKRE